MYEWIFFLNIMNAKGAGGPSTFLGEPRINVFVFGKYQIQYEHFICVYICTIQYIQYILVKTFMG